jgi:hypothetical protein
VVFLLTFLDDKQAIFHFIFHYLKLYDKEITKSKFDHLWHLFYTVHMAIFLTFILRSYECFSRSDNCITD